MNKQITILLLLGLLGGGTQLAFAQDPAPGRADAPRTNLQNSGQQPDYSPAAKPKAKKKKKKRTKRSKSKADKRMPAQTGKRSSGLNGEGGG